MHNGYVVFNSILLYTAWKLTGLCADIAQISAVEVVRQFHNSLPVCNDNDDSF